MWAFVVIVIFMPLTKLLLCHNDELNLIRLLLKRWKRLIPIFCVWIYDRQWHQSGEERMWGETIFCCCAFFFLTISSYFCSSVCCHKRTHTTLKEKIKDLKKIHIWLCCARVLRIVFLLLDVVVVLVPRPLLKTFSCILFCGWRSKLSESFWFYSKLKQLLLLLFFKL